MPAEEFPPAEEPLSKVWECVLLSLLATQAEVAVVADIKLIRDTGEQLSRDGEEIRCFVVHDQKVYCALIVRGYNVVLPGQSILMRNDDTVESVRMSVRRCLR